MFISVYKGDRVKINTIGFYGNVVFSDEKLRKKLKKTKQKFPLRFWKKSKYIAADYEADKQNLIDFYKEKGYRDARIISDTLIDNKNNTLNLNLEVDEGKPYFFGDIAFIGNTAYSDRQLAQILGLKKGDSLQWGVAQRAAFQTLPKRGC